MCVSPICGDMEKVVECYLDVTFHKCFMSVHKLVLDKNKKKISM